MLYTLIQKKAGDFPSSEGQDRYVAAAQEFRMPYWDWAIVSGRGQGVLPLSVQSETVNVFTPTSGGKLVPMDNPLYSFRFHPLNPTEGDFPDDSDVSSLTSLLFTLCLYANLLRCEGLFLHTLETMTDRLLVQYVGINCPLAIGRHFNLAKQSS